MSNAAIANGIMFTTGVLLAVGVAYALGVPTWTWAFGVLAGYIVAQIRETS